MGTLQLTLTVSEEPSQLLEKMSQLKLFCDRISHASRAPLLLLHSAKIPYEEVNVKLFRGENRKRPELPFKKLPVLVDGDLTVAESTTILRYIGQLPGAGAWYGDRSLKEKVKIDEYLDYWQSTLHPTAVKLLQNKVMYKLVFRKPQPDEKVVKESSAAHESHKKIFQEYFLGPNRFVGGDTASIADVLMASTLLQTSITGSSHDSLAKYLDDVKAATDPAFYEELHGDVQNIPSVLKSMKML